ncbi:hypothetical protein HanRHA438_Chr03g0101191 [Helianthus annuus]|uniref:Uncharacterized protein n=1 Tax=Helianthus annuus TaxID=4232 RepID=A0A9K3JC37_HELAN|nr:hypothetical protein HanXRQr2_Chr03g0089831 [Helianthus annuus]KAJ0933885.1 hypothetical protein HanRHA438_Chr03g0101191 [Helianthus annuus]KAJ0941961.1 hypothetical protein HanPSC8_Chr03g0086271 [Helianthus annuus]
MANCLETDEDQGDIMRSQDEKTEYEDMEDMTIANNKNYIETNDISGRGVTNTLVKKVDGACTSYMIPEGLMESFKATSSCWKCVMRLKRIMKEKRLSWKLCKKTLTTNNKTWKL